MACDLINIECKLLIVALYVGRGKACYRDYWKAVLYLRLKSQFYRNLYFWLLEAIY